LSFTATTLSPGVSVSDPDSPTLASATVQIAGGFAGDLDTLFVDTSAAQAINASYDSGSETLTLTGADTLTDYQAVLATVAFESDAADPTHAGANPTRTVTFTLNNGQTPSAPQTETVYFQAPVTIPATVLHEGDTVTATGGLSNDPSATLTYQWQDAGTDIGGATGSTYVVGED